MKTDSVSVGGVSLPPDLIVAAARCWRAARDAGHPVQPSLHATLAPFGCEMLVPVFDSLMALGEACLCRPGDRTCPFGKEHDEALICSLLADPSRLARSGCGRAADDGMVLAFNCALLSARIMMRLEGPSTEDHWGRIRVTS